MLVKYREKRLENGPDAENAPGRFSYMHGDEQKTGQVQRNTLRS